MYDQRTTQQAARWGWNEAEQLRRQRIALWREEGETRGETQTCLARRRGLCANACHVMRIPMYACADGPALCAQPCGAAQLMPLSLSSDARAKSQWTCGPCMVSNEHSAAASLPTHRSRARGRRSAYGARLRSELATQMRSRVHTNSGGRAHRRRRRRVASGDRSRTRRRQRQQQSGTNVYLKGLRPP